MSDLYKDDYSDNSNESDEMKEMEDYVEVDEDEKDEESSSDSEDDEDLEEQQFSEKLRQLQDNLASNPYAYDAHVELVSLLRSQGELDLLRNARQKMSEIFPLTPQLWLEWIKDEIKVIGETGQDKRSIIELFERALKDYVSVEIWFEYVQFCIGLMSDPEGVENCRKVFDRALISVGLHVSKGYLIWDSYREFEMAVLQTFPSETIENEMKAQIKRIQEIYKRQLETPLIGMENTFKEFQQWCKDSNLSNENILSGYEKALNELQNLKPYEEALVSSEAPHLNEYLRYIEYEETNGSPLRVQCIYERAITDNCLNSDLWMKFVKYQDGKVIVSDLIIPIYQRAVRNCPWSSPLWVHYLKALERLKEDPKNVISVFENSLQAGFSTGNEYFCIWFTYLNYLRRKTNFSDEKGVENLRRNFDKAMEHLSNFEDGDPSCKLIQYLAKIEAKFCKDMNKAREMWEELLSSRRDLSIQAQIWLEYANLEKCFGDDAHYRKILFKALQTVKDWPESIGQIILQYEDEEGLSIQEQDEALHQYEKVMKRTNERRQALAEKEKEAKKQKKTQYKQEKYELKRELKRKKPPESQETNQGVFKTPSLPSISKKAKTDRNLESLSVKAGNEKTDKNDEKTSVSKHGVTYKSDGTKDLQTVFLSNLDFKTDEDRIKEVFSQFGDISEVRLVRKFNGLSKGFCYVEYTSIEGAREALKHDRTEIDGRPVFVNEVGKKKGFTFSTTIEKNKLFIRNLPRETTLEELRNIFSKFGALKDVRIVTFRNGQSKGLAYVDYVDEVSASEAISKANNMLIGDRNIEVMISNPSVAKNPKSISPTPMPTPSLGSSVGQFSGDR